jgi:glycine dehydrogenase subunit 2
MTAESTTAPPTAPPDAPPAAGGRATSAPLLGRAAEPTLFELSESGRRSSASFRTTGLPDWTAEELVPAEHLAEAPVRLPDVAERDLAR